MGLLRVRPTGPRRCDVVVDLLEGQGVGRRPALGRDDGHPVVVLAPSPPSRGCRRRSRRGRAASGQSKATTSRVGRVCGAVVSLMDTTLGVTADTGLLDFCSRPVSRRRGPAAAPRPARASSSVLLHVEGHPQPPARSAATMPCSASSAAPRRPRPARGPPGPAGSSPAPAANAASTARAWAAAPARPTRSRRASEDAVPTQACHPGETSNRRASGASRSGVP